MYGFGNSAANSVNTLSKNAYTFSSDGLSVLSIFILNVPLSYHSEKDDPGLTFVVVSFVQLNSGYDAIADMLWPGTSISGMIVTLRSRAYWIISFTSACV